MNIKFIRIFSLLSLLAIISTACFFSSANSNQLDPAAQTAAAETVVAFAVQTQFAQLTSEAPTLQEASPAPPEAPTQPPAPTATDTPTPEPSLTPTPVSPAVVVSKNTNCRTGNAKNYDNVGALLVGEQADVLARDSGDYWYVRLPSGKMCWLWGEYATITGDTSHLPVFTPPPSPTPAPAFTFSYRGLGISAGNQCLLFDVKNTGGIVWESFRLEAQNTTQGVGGSITRDNFSNYDNWCASTGGPASLSVGESGTAFSIITMASNPSGNNGTAELKLCSQNGLAGQCLTQTINFTFP